MENYLSRRGMVGSRNDQLDMHARDEWSSRQDERQWMAMIDAPKALHEKYRGLEISWISFESKMARVLAACGYKVGSYERVTGAYYIVGIDSLDAIKRVIANSSRDGLLNDVRQVLSFLHGRDLVSGRGFGVIERKDVAQFQRIMNEHLGVIEARRMGLMDLIAGEHAGMTRVDQVRMLFSIFTLVQEIESATRGSRNMTNLFRSNPWLGEILSGMGGGAGRVVVKDPSKTQMWSRAELGLSPTVPSVPAALSTNDSGYFAKPGDQDYEDMQKMDAAVCSDDECCLDFGVNVSSSGHASHEIEGVRKPKNPSSALSDDSLGQDGLYSDAVRPFGLSMDAEVGKSDTVHLWHAVSLLADRVEATHVALEKYAGQSGWRKV